MYQASEVVEACTSKTEKEKGVGKHVKTSGFCSSSSTMFEDAVQWVAGSSVSTSTQTKLKVSPSSVSFLVGNLAELSSSLE
jgi:hypothetical protein